MKDFGITGKPGIWIFNFLTDRTQFVRIRGGITISSVVPVNVSGVPQGTVLGPLLFLILMFDISNKVTSSPIVSFADGTERLTILNLYPLIQRRHERYLITYNLCVENP